MDFEKFKLIWEEENIKAIDTSVFLDLYFYSSKTKEEIVGKIESIKETLWLPNQTLVEFDRNFIEVRGRAFKKYDSINGSFKTITKEFENQIKKLFRDHQHYEIPGMEKIKQEIDEEIKKINEKIKEYEKDIKEEKEKNREMLVNGKIENFIKIMAELKKVGEKYNIHELIEIYEEGEKRYKYKIPPGYKDITKDKIDDTKTHKYGDLIMWKQLMNQCNEKQKSLLFITNDVKEDWMDEIIQSPRKELVEEFKIECGENLEFTMMDFKTFYMNLSKLNKWNNIKSRVEIEAYDFIEKYLVDNKNEIIKEIEMKINDELLYEVIRIIEDSYGLEIEEFEEHNIKNLQIDDVRKLLKTIV